MAEQPPMKPTRDPRVTLDDLVEVLLNKGAVLHLDLIISVADIPLIGVNLRAAIAGMETMLEHGMMRQWDEHTRAWVEGSSARRGLDLRDGERHVAQMHGGHLLEEGVYTAWRPGTVFLTDQRLVVLRRDPREIMWQADLSTVRTVRPETERSAGGAPRTRVRLELDDDSTALLSAADPRALCDLLDRSLPGVLGEELRSGAAQQVLAEGHLWYQEPRRDGPLWRGGTGKLTPGGLVWKSPLDARPALAVPADDILGVRQVAGRSPGGEGTVLEVRTQSLGVLALAATDPAHWLASFRETTEGTAPAEPADAAAL
ncbi:gas vesicle protein [Streptomyces albidoflavus]|uniref:gas vesicle protein n=1 Tax=Streptomyces albidoflavus TaxID=1886 RepID=UPI0033FFFFE3